MSDPHIDPSPERSTRRELFGRVSSAAMATGLIAGYGTAGLMAARYLYPARPRARAWLLVAPVAEMETGASVPFRTPTGERVTVARQDSADDAESFVALSSTCPHLGCQVHWQEVRTRFFCPCHNGVFDPAGRAVSGPPADAGTDLPRYPLKLEAGLLYIEVPTEGLADASDPDADPERTA